MPRPSSSSLSRWARWGLLVTTLAMAAALLSTAWSSWKRVDEASELLLAGQGQSLVRMLGEHVRYSSDPNQADLASFVTETAELGVRYVEVRMRGGGVQRAGTPASASDESADVRGPAHRVVRVGDRVRMLSPVPPRPRYDQSAGFERRGHRGGFRPALVVVEFEPVVGNRLRHDAQRAFIVSSAVAGAFLLVSAAVWALLRQRERAEARAEQERRLAMLGEMSAVLAHEIRNPLASLKGHAQLLAEQLEAGSAPKRKAERVVKEALRLETLTSSLLDFVRSGSIKREAVNPGELVQRSAESVAGRFNVDTSQAPPSFSLDPLRMQQVFTNLLENAAQASPPEQAVDVKVGTDRGRLLVSIRDRGEGIPPGDEQHIFEAFHSTRTRGVGLGLAVALRIVELHGGTISARNHAAGGALFEISVPPES